MLQCSTYRGRPQSWVGDGVGLGVMSLGWDASLAATEDCVVAAHGYVGNQAEIAKFAGVGWAPDWSLARLVLESQGALGERFFARLRGEFAVLLFQRQDRRLLAVRGASASRPLFWGVRGTRAFVASEIRQIVAGHGSQPRMNREAWARFLVHEARDPGETLWEGVHPIAPGSIAEFTAGRPCLQPRAEAFWTPERALSKPIRGESREGLAERLRSILAVAVERALPPKDYAVALSGGIDSSSIWALLPQADRADCAGRPRAIALSLVFPGLPCDESSLIAANLERNPGFGVAIDPGPVPGKGWFVETVAALDSFFLINVLFAEVLARHARSYGRQVLLFGAGGDHFLDGDFGGQLRRLLAAHPLLWGREWLDFVSHNAQVRSRDAWALLWRPPSQLAHAAGRQLRRTAGVWTRGRRTTRIALDREMRRVLATVRPPGRTHPVEKLPNPLRASLLLQRLHDLEVGDDLLAWEQQTARLGIELRSPLLDLDLIEFALAAPAWAWACGPSSKALFRLAMGPNLPDAVRARRSATTHGSYLGASHAWFCEPGEYANWYLAREMGFDPGVLDSCFGGDYRSLLSTVSTLGVCEFIARKLVPAKGSLRRVADEPK
jgi:asparagine synthase (glutamine-hydrolysing)